MQMGVITSWCGGNASRNCAPSHIQRILCSAPTHFCPRSLSQPPSRLGPIPTWLPELLLTSQDICGWVKRKLYCVHKPWLEVGQQSQCPCGFSNTGCYVEPSSMFDERIQNVMMAVSECVSKCRLIPLILEIYFEPKVQLQPHHREISI